MVGLSIHVQFVGATIKPLGGAFGKRKSFGSKYHFFLLWIISGNTERLWGTPYQKFQIPEK